MDIHTEWPGTAALLKHYNEVRTRLRTPPNAVPDTGINLPNGKPARQIERAISPPRILPCQYKEKVKGYLHSYRTSFGLSNDNLTIRTVLNFVAKEFGLTRATVLARNKARNLVHARQVAVYLTSKHTTYNICLQAHYLGLHHGTVFSGMHTIAKIMAEGGPKAEKINDIEARLLAAFPRAALSPFHKPAMAERQGQDLQVPGICPVDS